MASYALVHAMNQHDCPIVGIPQRVPSKHVVDKMAIITESSFSQSKDLPEEDKETFIDGTASASASYIPRYTDKSPLLQKPKKGSNNTRKCVTGLLSVLTVVANVLQVVSIPLYVHSMTTEEAGSDPYVASFLAAMWPPAIFFLINAGFHGIPGGRQGGPVCGHPAPWGHLCLAGFLAGLNYILVAATSLPERTPAYLQSILSHSLIIFAAITRVCILRRGLTKGQLVCMVILFIGIFISLEPSIFNLRDEPFVNGWNTTGIDTDPGAWYYYVIYGFAWLPLALSYVLMEKGYEYKGRDIAYTAWVQLFVLLSHFIFVFLDFIPHIGLANTGSYNFWQKVQNGFGCFYGLRAECSDVPQLAILYVSSFAASNVFSILLIRYVRGAVYATVALALVSPISVLFWNFFSAVPRLHWSPFFDLATVFVIVGLCIMTPAVGMYSYFAHEHDDENGFPGSQENDTPTKVSGVPMRYHQGMPPRIRRQRTWSVTYVDLTKPLGRKARSLTDLDKTGRQTSDLIRRARSGSDQRRSDSETEGRPRSLSDAEERKKTKPIRPASKHPRAGYYPKKPHRIRHSKSAPIVYM